VSRYIKAGPRATVSVGVRGQFINEMWRLGVIPTLRSGSSRYYEVRLRCHILPTFGPRRLCDITRVDVQTFLADKRKTALLVQARTECGLQFRRYCRPLLIGIFLSKTLGLPLIAWHSFRHTHATQLAEVGESLRTAQSLLGHSDLEITLNVYTHAIPDAQRRAVDKVAEVLFTNVHKISAATENQKVS